MTKLIQPQPLGFIDHQYDFSFSVNAKPNKVWDWLNNPATFIDNQIWPYKVEFYSPDPSTIPNGFNEGVLNVHFGPFINFAGVITSIKEDYRDLQYFHGSYALGMRWIRPYRLQFWTEENENGTDTLIKCRINYWVTVSIRPIWDWCQKQFWKTFPRFARKNIVS